MNANAPLTLTSPRVPAHAANMINLNGGNQRRLRQAELRRQVTAGSLSVTAILMGTTGLQGDDLDAVEADTIGRLLGAQYYWGEVHVRALLTPRLVPENERIRDLGTRERTRLASALAHREKTREGSRRRNTQYRQQRRAGVTT